MTPAPPTNPSLPTRPLVSLVVPCFNEEAVFPILQQELRALAQTLGDQQGCESEIVLVDDGSRDRTWELISAFAVADGRVRGVRLSRNFGHQAALTCGYDLAGGDAVVSLDADLQDPPSVVPQLVEKWRAGADVVFAVRSARAGETHFKLLTAKLFYRFIRAMGAANVRPDTGDFRLMSRRSLDALGRLRERHRFIRGMVGWIGFRTDEVRYERKPRAAGTTKYPLRKMLLFALDATVSFSQMPLRLAYWGAFGLCVLFLAYVVYVLIAALFFKAPLTQGWASLMGAAIAFGAMNLLCLGLLGEYVGRIYEEVKRRPLYLVGDDAGVPPGRAGRLGAAHLPGPGPGVPGAPGAAASDNEAPPQGR